MFRITADIVTAHKTNFTAPKERGIYKIQGDKVSVITKQLEDVAVSLNEFDSLPEEAPLDTL